VIVTGSLFEPYEGREDGSQRAFSPYGLSKHVSFEVMRLEAHPMGIKLGKFVIPNPFGPYEEARFTSYMMREWSEGRMPEVQTPDYVRDNIHVSLLARAYVRFCEKVGDNAAPVTKCSPSGYVETQATFAQRFAREIGTRIGRNLKVKLRTQQDFSEPMVRTNLEPAVGLVREWFEDDAWNELCAYYKARFLEN
jgi:nucleoside-diphosphate-sugar epimerase